MRAVVSHENVTALKLAEEALKIREQELELKTQHLEEANTALKVLLKQREQDKAELESKVLKNINELISPHVAKLRNKNLKSSEKALIDRLNLSIFRSDLLNWFLGKCCRSENMSINVLISGPYIKSLSICPIGYLAPISDLQSYCIVTYCFYILYLNSRLLI